jgi:hypothetical protein
MMAPPAVGVFSRSRGGTEDEPPAESAPPSGVFSRSSVGVFSRSRGGTGSEVARKPASSEVGPPAPPGIPRPLKVSEGTRVALRPAPAAGVSDGTRSTDCRKSDRDQKLCESSRETIPLNRSPNSPRLSSLRRQGQETAPGRSDHRWEAVRAALRWEWIPSAERARAEPKLRSAP